MVESEIPDFLVVAVNPVNFEKLYTIALEGVLSLRLPHLILQSMRVLRVAIQPLWQLS